MRKTLREEILSVNIKKDGTYDEIINNVDNYCRKHNKNTSIRFALGFYYLFLTLYELLTNQTSFILVINFSNLVLIV